MAWVRPTKKQRRKDPVEFHQTDTFQDVLKYFSCTPMPHSTNPALIDHAKAHKHPRQRQKAIEGPPAPLLLEPPPSPPATRQHHRSKTAGAASTAKSHRSAAYDTVVVLEEDEDEDLEKIRRAVRREMQQFGAREVTPGAEERTRHGVRYESPVLRPRLVGGSASFVRSRPSHHHLGVAAPGLPKTASSRWAGATSALPGLS